MAMRSSQGSSGPLAMMPGALRAAWPIALVAAVALCCGNVTGPETASDLLTGDAILNVRVHLLQSDEFEALNATLDAADVVVLFAGANRIWDAAGVRWRIESVVREPARNAAAFDKIFRGEGADRLDVMLSIFPRENLLADGWDVFVLRDFGRFGASGVYISFPEAQVAFVAEIGLSGEQRPSGSGPRVLAHELGHSLGLQHVSCTTAGNLMAPGCRGQDRTLLTAAQIRTVRQQAAKGRPFIGNLSVANQR